jgi:hypothetical protein
VVAKDERHEGPVCQEMEQEIDQYAEVEQCVVCEEEVQRERFASSDWDKQGCDLSFD